MNVNDFVAPECPSTWREVLTQIFSRQRELMDKYKVIEQLPDPPLSLHTASGQRVMKDFAWRVTEELAEAFEAWLKHDDPIAKQQHRNEELADALHFLVELLIFAGITPAQCIEIVPEFTFDFDNDLAPPNADPSLRSPTWEQPWWLAVYELGLAMNFLRNKPWKQSQVPTDELRFRTQLLKAFQAHVQLWCWLNISMEEAHGFYFRKSQVNAFRQRSHY